MNHVVKAKMLRESDEPIHYNCAQSLFVAFSDVLGVSDERAFAMGANYGGGMMHGGTCGVVSAGLMILVPCRDSPGKGHGPAPGFFP